MATDLSAILDRIGALEGELAHLRQEVAATLFQATEPGEDLTVLECAAGGQAFGVLLSTVDEVLAVAELIPLPEAEPWILGTLNLRGESVVVIDMAHRLLGRAHVIEPSEYIVVCHDRYRRLGLLVDDIRSIENIPHDALQHPAPGVAFAPYLIGVWHQEERSLGVVEVGRVGTGGYSAPPARPRPTPPFAGSSPP
ncbi:MAG: purine-binding chemotaxis protein CheW [Polyangiaceae bacterium]|nr:purine-binding chemotaxis protein CheW [Polyangiaceae bacterium]